MPRVGLEQLQKLWGKTATFRKSDVPYRVVTTKIRRFGKVKSDHKNQVSMDPQLERVITIWDRLPPNIRQAILMMIEI